MARIFITGSADGLGQLAAKALVAQGHQVVLHARNENRAAHALSQVQGAESAISGDLASTKEIKELAAKVNGCGNFDAVIHNAGVYQASAKEILTVNTLAPYLLTCLIKKPQRLIYLSSDMHLQGYFDPEQVADSRVTYSDSKLHVLMLCKAVARKWTGVYANAINPGWVPTKMGGKGAPDDLQKGFETQVWLATGDDEQAKKSGGYFFHQKPARYNSRADEIVAQEQLLKLCEKFTHISLPH